MKRNIEVCKAVKAIVYDVTLPHEITGPVAKLLGEYEAATYGEDKERHDYYGYMVSKMVNDYGFDDDGLARKMATDHPTLQQSFMRFVLKFIRKMAEKPCCDGRNEASVRIAKEIVKVLDEKGEYLPFV